MADATDSLTGALINALEADAKVRALFGGPVRIWEGQTPEDETLPHCLVNAGEAASEWIAGRYYIDTTPVTFEVYAVSLEASEAARDLILATLIPENKPAIVFATEGNLSMGCLPTGGHPGIEVERSPQGDVVGSASVVFNAMVQRVK